MKKIFYAITVSVILLSTTAFAAQFSDLPETHWAYSAVMELVDDGTVNGDESGHFNPDSQVTRAEMVKMIGKGTSAAEYADVDASHWGYEYIAASGVAPDENGAFRPSEAMTRGDAAELLWQRAGSPIGADAPESVKSQHKNKDAAAWAYSTGIMRGYANDSMMYENGISRAEAAAVIVRARNEIFAYRLGEIPQEVYDAPLGDYSKSPRDTYNFAKEFDGLFKTVTAQCEKIAKEQYGVDSKITFYPTLAWNTGSSYKYRVKCEVVSTGGQALVYKDVFGGESGEAITDGMVFWADIESDYAFGMGIGALFNFSDPVFVQTK